MRRPVRSVITENVAEHPAVEAWTRAGPGRRLPERVLVLCEARRRSAYRLPGVGVDGGAVIAKRCRISVARLERTIYEDILPHLSLPTPRYYGSWLDGPRGWLLLEDVSGEPYRRDDREHQRLASQWVGMLHGSATGLDAARILPDAGPARYLEHLRQGREKVRRAMQQRAFSGEESRVLEAVASRLDAVEADWKPVEALCEDAPDTLVHGDIQAKNLFPQRDGDQMLHAIDWEMAGFGCPAADLTRIDLDHYWSSVRPAWPGMTPEGVRRLATVGHLLQALAQVHWLSEWLRCEDREDRASAVTRFVPLLEHLADSSRSVRRLG